MELLYEKIKDKEKLVKDGKEIKEIREIGKKIEKLNPKKSRY